jgi:hypothetical protein
MPMDVVLISPGIAHWHDFVGTNDVFYWCGSQSTHFKLKIESHDDKIPFLDYIVEEFGGTAISE